MQIDIPIDMLPESVESGSSIRANCGSTHTVSAVNSIPPKLKEWYSHRSFTIIICAWLSTIVISSSFAGLFLDKIDSCSTLAISSTVVALWSPSPLSSKSKG